MSPRTHIFRNPGLSYIFRFLDTSLNLRNDKAFWEFLWVYGWIVLIALPIVASYRFTRLKLARYWREWLTNNFLERYFHNRAFYLLDSNTEDSDIDNPDQRISEDIRNFTTVTLDFLIDTLYAILTVFAFSAILWSISKTLTIGAKQLVVQLALLRISKSSWRYWSAFTPTT